MINLIGHTINKAALNREDGVLSLTVDGDKVFLLKVEGDCCSSGKFIGVKSELDLDLPQKVVGVENRSEKFDLDDSLYQVYEDTLVLGNGEKFKIVYDNESNGYYGSSLEVYYGGKRIWQFPEAEEPQEKKG